MTFMATIIIIANTISIEFHPIDNNSTNMIFVEVGDVSIPRSRQTLTTKINFSDIIDEVKLLVANIERLASIGCNNTGEHECSHPQSNVPYVLFKINASMEAAIHNRNRNVNNLGCNYALPYSSSAELDVQQFNTKIIIFTNNLSVQKIFLNGLGDAIRIFQQPTMNDRSTENSASTDFLQLNDTVQYHLQHILQVERIINDVWDAVISAADDKFDAIATYANVSQAIGSMRANLKPGDEFYSNDIATNLKTTRIDIFLTANYLEMTIEFPIKDSRSQYKLFQVSSIPFYLISNNNNNNNRTGDDSSLFRISTLFDYIAYNAQTGSTIPVTKFQVTQCKNSMSSEKICSTISRNRPDYYYCEMNLFLNRSALNCLIERYPKIASSITKVKGDTFFYIANNRFGNHHGLEIIDSASKHIMYAINNTWFALSPAQRLRYNGNVIFSGSSSGRNSVMKVKESPIIIRRHCMPLHATNDIINRTILPPTLADTIFLGRNNYLAHNSCDSVFTSTHHTISVMQWSMVALILLLPL